MALTPSWRNFRRTEDCAAVAGALVYAAAVLHAWQALPGSASLKTAILLAFPVGYLALTLLIFLGFKPIRRRLKAYVWMSFEAGFGQSVLSILVAMAILFGIASLLYLEVGQAQAGGRYPAGVFSGYAAGIGILIAQAILARDLERDPVRRAAIDQAP